MKNITISSVIAVSALFLLPGVASAKSFDAAVKQANSEIDKAAAMNYEWRDSRKMIKEAQELNEAGKTDEAIALVEKAEQQGKLAVAQAKRMADVNGPHN
jgi:hypothetical protein